MKSIEKYINEELIKQHEALKLADKIYLNSYECMWNDAMIHSYKNNFFMILGVNK